MFLNADRTAFSMWRIFAILLPRVGRGQLDRVLGPSKKWLDPVSGL
jgi:hypothetical protein